MSLKGFRFGSTTVGLKQTGKPDLTVIISDVPANAVGAFTSNKVCAAPVQISVKNIKRGICRAIIVNSGNANACTGKVGLRDATAMVRETAKSLKVKETDVLVCSTGKIGIPMPMNLVIPKIKEVVASAHTDGFAESAEAILTTDQSAKVAMVSGTIQGKPYEIKAFAKGAGMIEPHMTIPHATMLAYILTDAFIPRTLMKKMFERAVEETFNCVTVDGDMSTNDTAVFLANGLAGNKVFRENDRDGKSFYKNLHQVMLHLAKMMVMDGEGATKCVRLEIKGAKNDREASKLAYTIGNSPLVKTSFFGGDPNWGRLLGAAGRAGVTLNQDKISVHYDDVCVAKNGISTGIEADRAAKKVMQAAEFTICLDIHLGKGRSTLYTSDLTLDYVKLNSCYRT